MTKKTRRIADIVLLLAAFTLPWWLVFPVAVLCLFIFEKFYEIFAIGFIFDNLYGVPLRSLPKAFFYILISATLFVAVSVLKRRLKFYI